MRDGSPLRIVPPRSLLLLAASCLAVALLAPAPANAGDTVVARQTGIGTVLPLGRVVVYARQLSPPATKNPRRIWMRRVHGHLRRAHGIPPHAYAADIGRDNRGHAIVTYTTSHGWFIYDVARDRARRLRGLPGKRCRVEQVSVWRHRMAYSTYCERGPTGVFLRVGKRTRRLTPYYSELYRLVLRRGSLAGVSSDGDGDRSVVQYMSRGKRCGEYGRSLDTSFASAESIWTPSDAWIANGHLTWTMGSWSDRPDFGILSAKLHAHCAEAGPTGWLRFRPRTKTVRALAIDGRHAFYAGPRSLRRQTLPAKPSFAPPANDDFENARQLPGEAPFSVSGRVGYATPQPGEPLADWRQTVWYAYRPTTSQRVYVYVDSTCRVSPEVCGNAPVYGVYTGSSVDALTAIPPGRYSSVPDSPETVRIDTVPGQTYWIAVAKSLPLPNYAPFFLRTTLSPPDFP